MGRMIFKTLFLSSYWYSGQICFFEFSCLASLRGCKFVQYNQEGLKPKPRALFYFTFCLEVNTIASMQICRFSQHLNLEIPTVENDPSWIIGTRLHLSQLAKSYTLQKSKPKSTKCCNKQTNKTNKRPFFLPKINTVFLGPILQNLKGRFWTTFFLKSILSTQQVEKDAVGQKVWCSKPNLPLSSHSQTAKIFPLKGF